MKTLLVVVLVLGVVHCKREQQDEQFAEEPQSDPIGTKGGTDSHPSPDCLPSFTYKRRWGPARKYEGKCMSTRRWGYLCPTAVDSDGKFINWRKCKDVDICATSPCQNGLKCGGISGGHGGYFCTFTGEYTGKNCDKVKPSPPKVLSFKECIFPFVRGTKLYHECYKYNPLHSYSICPTAYDVTNNRYMSVSSCKSITETTVLNTNVVDKQEETINGDLCFFPFTVEGSEEIHNTCFNDKGVYKCPTGYADGKFNQLEECSQDAVLNAVPDAKVENVKSAKQRKSLIKVIKRHSAE